MIDFQRQFHTGLLVRDLRAAMEQYGRSLNLTWATPFLFEALPLWTPETGLQHLRLEVTYSVEGPQHLEIQIGPKGSYYDPDLRHGLHMGVWVEDVAAEARAAIAQGWRVEAAGDTPEAGWGTFAYIVPPGGGLTVELVSTALQPAMEAWWSGSGSLG